jgi:hypothetical protein
MYAHMSAAAAAAPAATTTGPHAVWPEAVLRTVLACAPVNNEVSQRQLLGLLFVVCQSM